ncbi:hypothetical protein EHV15_06070 [Paenibacillus oralis]|uniref:Uncharacterized protein n=1 Tax=Paenibacillus oralis TaxID=2490856 RepID=A0A3P3TXQ2_9BACL|nr:hypothetical protein [Paenibacillus oralis]RRJ62564.1 hypothetical protein EHV15_06070 [Paenibacillus oralis]
MVMIADATRNRSSNSGKKGRYFRRKKGSGKIEEFFIAILGDELTKTPFPMLGRRIGTKSSAISRVKGESQEIGTQITVISVRRIPLHHLYGLVLFLPNKDSRPKYAKARRRCKGRAFANIWICR